MISERFFSHEKCNIHPIPCRQLVSIPPDRLCIRGSSNSSNLPLVAINTSNQLPYKLTHSNYPSWRATFLTILIGYDLMGYLDETIKFPPTSAATFSSPAIACYAHWLRQDQLLLNTIFSFVLETVMPLIAMSSTSHDVWQHFARLFSSKFWARIMQLKEDLWQNSFSPCCQLLYFHLQKWEMATRFLCFHNITSDLANLSIYSEYDGQDEVVPGNGTSLQITHIGSTSLPSTSCSISLKETFHVSLIKKIYIIFVHKFTHDNDVIVEFHPYFFLVKDLMTGIVLMHDRCEDGVYPMAKQPSPYQAHAINLVGTRVPFEQWHHRLGHPTPKLLFSLLRSHLLPVSLSKSSMSCISCQCNKSHKFPFTCISLTCHAPLEFVYADIWGHFLVSSIDDFRYYVIFVDYFTKYCWFYPMNNNLRLTIFLCN